MRLRNLLLLALCCAAPLAAAGGEPSQHEVLHFSAQLMFWEYVTFGIVVAVLGFKVIPIMLKQLGARQDRIKDALDKADQVRAEAEVLLKKHEEMMRNAHADAKKITDEATVAAREAAAKITADAEAAARETRDRAQRELDQMRRKAESELRDAAIELALLAGGRVLEKSLTGEDHRRLAKEAIDASALMKN